MQFVIKLFFPRVKSVMHAASCLHSIQELDCSTVCSTSSTLPPDEPLQIWSSAFKKCFCVIRFKPHYTVTVLKRHTISQKEKCECINAVLDDMAVLLALAIVFDNIFWIPMPFAVSYDWFILWVKGSKSKSEQGFSAPNVATLWKRKQVFGMTDIWLIWI